jgi:hypothetical protein
MLRIVIRILLFFIPYHLAAQIFPKEESHLNYRIIGFSFPTEKRGANCNLEIAQGNFSDISSFKKNIIKSVACENDRIIAEVPFWGCDYTWRIINSGRVALKKNELHHFNTLMNANIDTAQNRLRIVKQAEQYKDAYVFIDDSHAMYDMNGNSVWFLPDVDHKVAATTSIRDMKLTPQGTITFTIENGGIYEINYDGAILWKGPNTGEVSGDNTEHYHHE